MKKSRSATLFILAVIIIISLTFAGFKGVEIGGWEFKSFGKAITKGLDLQGGVSVLMEITDEDLSTKDLDNNLEKTKQLLDLRVNKLGVAETTVTVEGDRRIRVDIPGQFDSKEIVDSLQKTGNLTFKDSEGNEVLNGKDVEEASVMTDNNTGKPVVTLKLNEEGKQKFTDATEKNLNKTISIYMDEDLISSPRVESVITGGEAIITGSNTIDEAKNLAGLINSGALPVTLKVASIENVGAQLGTEAMPNAVKAGAVGILLIFLFMILNYRMLGVIASMTLTLYTTLVLIVFVETNVTLTLPGIAGFLLTIGMAVDANVLIFERIKEDMSRGVSAKSAVKSGFHNALSSIVDSNVTTIIAALVLYFMGTGPVKGFAVTLMIGIVLSMFTAIFVTRKLTEWAINIGMLSKPWHFKVKRG